MNRRGPKSIKDFENRLEFWRDFGKMACEEIPRLVDRIALLEGLLRETENHFAYGSKDDGMNLWSRISDALPLSDERCPDEPAPTESGETDGT